MTTKATPPIHQAKARAALETYLGRLSADERSRFAHALIKTKMCTTSGHELTSNDIADVLVAHAASHELSGVTSISTAIVIAALRAHE